MELIEIGYVYLSKLTCTRPNITSESLQKISNGDFKKDSVGYETATGYFRFRQIFNNIPFQLLQILRKNC
jgi:hypothetical protein